MLRDQFSAAASLLPVRNQIEASANPDHDALPNANIAPTRLDIPLLNLSLKALVAQQSFSFSRFWRAPPSDLPISMDEELAGGSSVSFLNSETLHWRLGGRIQRRLSHLRDHRACPLSVPDLIADPQAEVIDLLTSLNDLPEQVLRFAPKKVRNVGSFHPARTALRTAINGLEAAKARHNNFCRGEQARELDLAPERMLAALGEADQATSQHKIKHDKSVATQGRDDKGLFLHFVARQAERQKSRQRAERN